MATLNIVNKSPYEKRSLDQCMNRLAEGDSVLLIEDATVIAVGQNSYREQLQSAAGKVNWYVLQPDLQARGMAGGDLVEGVTAVNYEGFVDLVTDHDRVHSWQ